MRKTFCISILVFIFAGIKVQAQQYGINKSPIIFTISYEDAQKAAELRLTHPYFGKDFTIKNTRIAKNDSVPFAYIFDLTPEGFIIISGSYLLPPVIAYSTESTFGDLNNNNPLYVLISSDISGRLTYCNTSGIEYAEKNQSQWDFILHSETAETSKGIYEQWPSDTDGWLKTNWTQNSPYNNMCPFDPVTSQRSIAGCPAVAMAQIINFHRSTNQTYFTDSDDFYHNYAGRQYWIDDDYFTLEFPSFPELNDYLDTLNAHYINGIILTNQDKAALTFACGVACTQVYTSQGSGTFGVNQAYNAYIRFGFATVSLLDDNDADLYERLKQNIKDTLPAHLAVVDSLWSMGHNVVVDGYNTDEYYHLNFGWGGSYNGWYLLPAEIPYNLTVVEGVVLDINKSLNASVHEQQIQYNSINVFPNPANDRLTVHFANPENKSLYYSIVDVNGRMIIQRQQFNVSHFEVETAILQSGTYFLTITNENNQISGKGKFLIE